MKPDKLLCSDDTCHIVLLGNLTNLTIDLIFRPTQLYVTSNININVSICPVFCGLALILDCVEIFQRSGSFPKKNASAGKKRVILIVNADDNILDQCSLSIAWDRTQLQS